MVFPEYGCLDVGPSVGGAPPTSLDPVAGGRALAIGTEGGGVHVRLVLPP